MKKINWGIIGCGDVTEIKSGPAFNKVGNSELIAVMRRDGAKAKDYAERHGVPEWYDAADKIIFNKNINAIYIATPPSSHEDYAIAAMNAGKHVYVEKPMTINTISAKRMMNASKETNMKMCVAHYRRAQPYFQKIKQLIDEKVIGDIQLITLEFSKKIFSKEELELPGNKWRVDAQISGGGLFHDLAPHQLDLMYFFFGEPLLANGIALNQSKLYKADDIVCGNIFFKSNVAFIGVWRFNVNEDEEKDFCNISGTNGSLSFSIFHEQKIIIKTKNYSEEISFMPPRHVQQPMIEKVVSYFLNENENPCSAEDGVVVMQLLDEFIKNRI